MSYNSFNNKIICLTGASSGIGEAILRGLSRYTCTVIIASRSIERLTELKKELENDKMRIHVLALDLSDSLKIKKSFKELKSQFDRIDILINNAGISQRSFAKETEYHVVEKILKVNFLGTIEWTTFCLPLLSVSKKAQIAVISSMVGEFEYPLRSAYVASKQALSGYFKTMQMETNSPLITIVSPGGVQTNISVNAVDSNGSAYGKMDDRLAIGWTAEKAAFKILKAIKKGKKQIYIGRKETILMYISRFCPPLFRLIVKNIKST